MKEDYYARQLSAVWGETVEPQELLHARRAHLERRAALQPRGRASRRADDTLPPRLLHEPVPAGPSKGQVVDLPPMLDEYYISRGWDEGGVPSAAKLERLGLTETAAAAGVAPGAARQAGGGRLPAPAGRPPRELGRPRAVPADRPGPLRRRRHQLARRQPERAHGRPHPHHPARLDARPSRGARHHRDGPRGERRQRHARQHRDQRPPRHLPGHGGAGDRARAPALRDRPLAHVRRDRPHRQRGLVPAAQGAGGAHGADRRLQRGGGACCRSGSRSTTS